MTPSVEFFEPAPLHRPGELDARVERRYRRIQTAGLQLQRLVAVFTALVWPVSVLAAPYRWSTLEQTPDLSVDSSLLWVFVLFTSCSMLLVAAAIRHRRSWYLVTFRLSASIYLGMLAVHVLAVVLTGDSFLTDVRPFDYPIVPMGLVLLAAPRRVSYPLCVAVLLIVSLVNQAWPLTSASIVEAAWAGILVIPFLLLFGSVMDSVREMDRAASLLRRQVIKTAGSRVLREAEVHFTGFLHDKVLQHLSGVRRSLVDPVVPDYDFERSELEVNSRARMLERSLPKAIPELSETLQSVAPDAQIEIPGQLVTRSSIPTLTMNVLSDAAVEALGNSVWHAPDAQRTVEFEVEWAPDGQCLSLAITISDDGPGFEMANIGEDRAGLRISVLGRMRASPGCDVDLMTAPGEGTSVHLIWRRSDCEHPEVFAMPGSWLSEKLNGLGRVFPPAFGVFTVIAVAAMGMLQDHPQHSFLFAAAVVMVIPVMWGLSRGSPNRLSGRLTATVAIGLVAFVTLASAEQVAIIEAWPGLWFTGPFALMCAYLVIRDQAAVAWVTFGIGLLPFLAFGVTGPTPDLVGTELMNMMVLMVTGSGFPILFRRALKSLSHGLRMDGTAATDLALAASQRGYLRDSGAWLRRQLEMVLNPATPADRRRRNAGLLEQRLRDAIRSPGFDAPETSRAVWLAREAGVKVTLRDDRRDDNGEDPDPDPVAHTKFHRALQESLTRATSHPEPATVNARLLPAGRNQYGTILVGAGEQSHQVLVSRDPADQPAPAGHPVFRGPFSSTLQPSGARPVQSDRAQPAG